MMFIKDINEFLKAVLSPKEKFISLISKYISRGGDKFFNKIDDIIKSNKDIILYMFKKILRENGNNINIVVSGSFGLIFYNLYKEGKLKFNGSLVLVNGSITSHQNNMNGGISNNEVYIKKKIGDIKNKKFIFFDDSYYSGTTFIKINNHLNLKNSQIEKIYVIYDGNDKKTDNIKSLFKYYDYYNGSEIPKKELLRNLKEMDSRYYNIISKRILNGDIKTNRELITNINMEYNNQNIDNHISIRKYKNSNE